MDGVTFRAASGSLAGSLCSGSSSRVTAWCQPSRPMPAMRNSTLKALQTQVLAGGALPTRGSPGQLLV